MYIYIHTHTYLCVCVCGCQLCNNYLRTTSSRLDWIKMIVLMYLLSNDLGTFTYNVVSQVADILWECFFFYSRTYIKWYSLYFIDLHLVVYHPFVVDHELPYFPHEDLPTLTPSIHQVGNSEAGAKYNALPFVHHSSASQIHSRVFCGVFITKFSKYFTSEEFYYCKPAGSWWQICLNIL